MEIYSTFKKEKTKKETFHILEAINVCIVISTIIMVIGLPFNYIVSMIFPLWTGVIIGKYLGKNK